MLSVIRNLIITYQGLFRFLGAALALAVLWGLKGPLANLITSLVIKTVNRRRTLMEPKSIRYVLTPLRALIVALGIFIILPLFGYPIQANMLLYKALRIAVLAIASWMLTRLWDCTAELLFSMNDTLSQQLSINLSKTLITFFRKAVKVLIIALAAVAILSETGANVTALITGLGLGGLTFALAAQDTAANLFSGLIILIDRPFAVDDWIQTPAIEGVVEDITFRSSRIRTFSNSLVIVPNSTLTSQPITNWSRMEKRKVSCSIGVEYGAAASQLESCVNHITQMLEENENVVPGSAVVNFEAFGDSSLEIAIAYFTKTTAFSEYQKVKEQVNFAIMAIVEKEGLSFAYPTQTIHLSK